MALELVSHLREMRLLESVTSPVAVKLVISGMLGLVEMMSTGLSEINFSPRADQFMEMRRWKFDSNVPSWISLLSEVLIKTSSMKGSCSRLEVSLASEVRE